MNLMLRKSICLVDILEFSKKNCAKPILGKLAYATTENFMGQIVDGYDAEATDVILLTFKAAHALCEVQNQLTKQNLGLFIFDAYRPLRAVKHFVRWINEPSTANELNQKIKHYPNLDKSELTKLGYIADKISKHNYGSTVDLSLINQSTGELVNMGAIFDFFDELSHQGISKEILGAEAFEHRQILTQVMQQWGFIPYAKEYWHFDFHKQEVLEPMDIPIDKSLKGFNT